MIAVDTSAIMAILNQEPEAATFAHLIEQTERLVISATNYVETSMVVTKLKTSRFDPQLWLDEFLQVSLIEIEPVTLAHAEIARAAFLQFGKGTGHGARLNLGDCFSYALAKGLHVPLLFKGDDFAKTDIRSALT